MEQQQSQADCESSAAVAAAAAAAASYPKILQWSVVKIAESRRSKSGIDLRRNLLIANVIFKARNGLLQWRARHLLEERALAQATPMSDVAAPLMSAAPTSDNLTSDIALPISDAVPEQTSDSDTPTSTSDSSAPMDGIPLPAFHTRPPSPASPGPDAPRPPVVSGIERAFSDAAGRRKRRSCCQSLTLPAGPAPPQPPSASSSGPLHSPPKRPMLDDPPHQPQHQQHQQLLVLQTSFLDLSVGSSAQPPQALPCLICSS